MKISPLFARSFAAPLLLALLLGACTPADIGYCQRQGLAPGTAPFGDCLNYYQRMQSQFDVDRALCGANAERTYPDFLYDRGRNATTTVIGPDGRTRTVRLEVEPDYSRNASLDHMRRSIVEPCMQGKGWMSMDSWEYGRVPEPQPASRRPARR